MTTNPRPRTSLTPCDDQCDERHTRFDGTLSTMITASVDGDSGEIGRLSAALYSSLCHPNSDSSTQRPMGPATQAYTRRIWRPDIGGGLPGIVEFAHTATLQRIVGQLRRAANDETLDLSGLPHTVRDLLDRLSDPSAVKMLRILDDSTRTFVVANVPFRIPADSHAYALASLAVELDEQLTQACGARGVFDVLCADNHDMGLDDVFRHVRVALGAGSVTI